MFQVIKVNTLDMNGKIKILIRDTEPKNTITIKNTNTLDEFNGRTEKSKGSVSELDDIDII